MAGDAIQRDDDELEVINDDQVYYKMTNASHVAFIES